MFASIKWRFIVVLLLVFIAMVIVGVFIIGSVRRSTNSKILLVLWSRIYRP